MKSWALFLALLVTPLLAASAAEQTAPAPAAVHEIFRGMNALRLDPAQVYRIVPSQRIGLHRSDTELRFDEGELAFYRAYEGRITGAVFSGRGHVLAVPRDVMEKQQMALFTGTPVLDEDFSTAFLRFNDGAAEELLQQLHSVSPATPPDEDFLERWNALLALFNPVHSLRIALGQLSGAPRPYFFAAIDGFITGPLNIVLDQSREDSLMIGQLKTAHDVKYYDVWTSYPARGADAPAVAFRALRYEIDATIESDMNLTASAVIHMRATAGGSRLVVFQLARALAVSGVEDGSGRPLEFFQNDGLSTPDRDAIGADTLCVILPAAPGAGQDFALRVRYRGRVIHDAGNGVLIVGARESWYPHFGSTGSFADYVLNFRWPKRLKLVATGTKSPERLDGEHRSAQWRSEKPLAEAGFNVGEYAVASIHSGGHTVEVYANRQLEEALSRRLETSNPPQLPVPFGLPPQPERLGMQAPPPSPASYLTQIGKDVESSIRFYERLSGPFPYPSLSVSQIPGTFGQGWPGLLYVSTFSFLPPAAQERAGLSNKTQEDFSELVPFHEVAHQWWGNVVGWSSYRDQWIDEAIANYLALLFADSQKRPDQTLRAWLDRYRHQLTDKPPAPEIPAADIGALELGLRLSSSKAPSGFEEVVYGKGAWVMHMLREMLREPGAKDPDARFIALLHTLVSKYAYRSLTTEDFQREIEHVMTPSMALEGGRSMDWFFDEWVRGTGVPRYRVEFSVHPGGKGFAVKGKLYQSGVPHYFIAPVPLYSNTGEYLGRVIATGPETPFHFAATRAPAKIGIDPKMTLLCVPEK